MIKKFLYACLLLLFVFGIVGCSSGQSPAPDSSKEAEQPSATPAGDAKPGQLTISSGPSGGNWYATGAALSDILSRAGVPTSSVPGGGTANVVAVATGKAEVGICQLANLASAVKGERPFDKAYPEVAMLLRLDPNPAYFLVPADSPIKTLADIKGKKIAGPAPGTSAQMAIGDVMAALGLDEEKDVDMRRGSLSEGAELFKDRIVDVYTVTTGVPNATIADMAVSLPVRFLSVPDEIVNKMIEKNSGYSNFTIPAGTYQGQNEDIHTVTSDCSLIVNKNLPEEHAYWLTKNIVENWNSILDANSWMKSVNKDQFGNGGGLPVHPGATKFYEGK